MQEEFIYLLQIQNKLKNTKTETFAHVEKLISTNLTTDTNIVMLPEMFNCPYDIKSFPDYAEPYQAETYHFLKTISKKYNIYLIGGSFPEKDSKGNIYNTSYVFDNQGNEIACHKKIHLFDINIKNGQYFKESAILSSGNKLTVFSTPWGNMGLCICFDFRFPELTTLMVNKGAKIIFVPAAFNSTTGPLHWELLFRSRAVDNQVFTVGTATALDSNASYKSWGHSIVVSPWGKILNISNKEEATLSTAINLKEISTVRQELPLLNARRNDLYQTMEISNK